MVKEGRDAFFAEGRNHIRPGDHTTPIPKQPREATLRQKEEREMVFSTHLISPPSSGLSLPKPSPASKLSAQAKPNKENYPTMLEIVESSRSQNLKLQIQTLGPFFRIRATSTDDGSLELGRAEGAIKPWIGGNILHLDSMKMSNATLGLDRSIFGLALFVGAAAIRHGYDRGCRKAELLAIYDTELYHSKLVRFYTRMGFKAVRVVDGTSLSDLPHLLVWGGKGTRMDADIQELMEKWSKRLKPNQSQH